MKEVDNLDISIKSHFPLVGNALFLYGVDKLMTHRLSSSQIIILSASANKLAKLKANAATYAALIMEELDPDGLGYIEVPRHLLNFQRNIRIWTNILYQEDLVD